MTLQPIIESGMTFGPFVDGHCFYIEKSATYQRIQEGVQIAEFSLIRTKENQPPVVFVIEAKSSSPKPETQPNFDDFIDEIREKLTNALCLTLAACMNRHPIAVSELPDAFKTLDLSTTTFRLILIIKGHKEAWLESLQNAVSKSLHATVKTWALTPTSVAVINDKLARKYGLITAAA
ncbi:MAG: hypothetical protein WA056_09290 [Gallionella sp.]